MCKLGENNTEQMYAYRTCVASQNQRPVRMRSCCCVRDGAVLQTSSTLGGNKPLHRFMKGQPKIVGIVLLIIGSSFFIMSIALGAFFPHKMLRFIQPGFWLGPTVTASLAVSIVALLAALWVAVFTIPSDLIYQLYNSNHELHSLLYSLHLVFEVDIIVGVFILIIMSALAGASLRSSHTQAQVVMVQSQLSTE
ncbi:unnamed protein product [Merluccius merluccius]